MKVKVIGCNVLKEELENIPIENTYDWEFTPMGLHNTPEKLREELQKVLDSSVGYDLIIMSYGLCGRGTAGLVATNCPMVMPLVHDCIPLLMGSKETHRQQNAVKGGTYFLSAGWTEGGMGILEDHQRTLEKYGPERTAKVEKMLYGNYNRLLYIDTLHPRKEQGLTYATEAANLLDLELQRMEGREEYLTALLTGPWPEDRFLRVEKGDTIDENVFMGQ